MILDVIVAVIVIGTMIQGYRHGLLRTLIHTVGWVVAIALGFIWSPKFNEFIINNTKFYDFIYGNINEKISTTLTPTEMLESLPTIIQEPLLNLTNSFSGSISLSLSNLLFTIACFLVITFAIQAIFHLLIVLLSKEHNDGLTGFCDGFMGILFGFFKGIVYVFIILAIMVPIASLANPKVITFLMENLQTSHIASDLYNNNLLMLIIKDLF